MPSLPSSNLTVNNEYSFNYQANTGKSMSGNDAEEGATRQEEGQEEEEEEEKEKDDDDGDDNRRSEILTEHFNVKELLTTDQLQSKPYVQSSNQPEVMIDGRILRWPKFGIKSVIFKSK